MHRLQGLDECEERIAAQGGHPDIRPLEHDFVNMPTLSPAQQEAAGALCFAADQVGQEIRRRDMEYLRAAGVIPGIAVDAASELTMRGVEELAVAQQSRDLCQRPLNDA